MRPHVPLLQSTKPCNALSPGPKGHLCPRRSWKWHQHFYLQHQQSPIALPITLETTMGTPKGKTISKRSENSAECKTDGHAQTDSYLPPSATSWPVSLLCAWKWICSNVWTRKGCASHGRISCEISNESSRSSSNSNRPATSSVPPCKAQASMRSRLRACVHPPQSPNFPPTPDPPRDGGHPM